MKCNDCGTVLTEENITHVYRRDVCDKCWDIRDELILGKIASFGSPEFKEILRKMAYGKGTAKCYIDSLRT